MYGEGLRHDFSLNSQNYPGSNPLGEVWLLKSKYIREYMKPQTLWARPESAMIMSRALTLYEVKVEPKSSFTSKELCRVRLGEHVLHEGMSALLTNALQRWRYMPPEMTGFCPWPLLRAARILPWRDLLLSRGCTRQRDSNFEEITCSS
jgi:hypothetical protein